MNDYQNVAVQEKGWTDFFSFCNPVRNKTNGNWWQLRDRVREQSLKRLQSLENLIQALDANPERTRETSQILFERILKNDSIDIDQLKREDLVFLLKILDWVKGIIPVESLQSAIQQAIPMADLLAPMQRLAKENFVGRKKELERLNQYVGIQSDPGMIRKTGRFILGLFLDLDKNPPFLIYGPGGVGKSTLLAKFILDNAESIGSGALPFAYLDVDRAALDPENPDTFIFEAARQLATQLPDHKQRLLSLKEEFEFRSSQYDKYENSKSFRSTQNVYDQFASIIRSIDKPVLMVIDTFEEVQYLGREIVQIIWEFLVSLQKRAPNLRTIVAGRSMIKEFPVQDQVLKELSIEEAQQLLKSGLSDLHADTEPLQEIIDDIINVVGLNPLSLQLACSIVYKEGIDKLKKIETRSWLFLRVRSEVVQARLYGRILAHVHDEEVKKLAYPGLIVRRITAEIILYVLAGPCNLKAINIKDADYLMNILASEVSLVDPDPEDGALYHKQYVRRIMLSDLKNEINPDTVRKIHENAIQYYSAKDDNISRAELIYHLLSKGGGLEQANALWRPGLDSRLRNALEELQNEERIWLSKKLGVTPDTQLLKNADLENWEEITAVSAQRLLQSGKSAEALKLLRERDGRSPASPLCRIELETLRTLGLYDEAEFMSEEILSRLPATVPPSFTRELLLQAAFIKEAQGNIDYAISYITEAENMATGAASTIEHLRALITHIRLLRKKGDHADEQRATLIDQAMALVSDPSTYSILNDSPALLRETVAELGKIAPRILDEAINRVGIEIISKDQIGKLSEGLFNWNNQLQSGPNAGIGELAERAGLPLNSLEFWNEYIERMGVKNISGSIQNWRKELAEHPFANTMGSEFDKVLVDIYRNTVDGSINRNTIGGGPNPFQNEQF